MVEVNSSYYALPSSSNAELWAERTPPDFNFNIMTAVLLSPETNESAAAPMTCLRIIHDHEPNRFAASS
ncbi:DUF72 domain-containing protein [Rhizobacter sp. Root404]|uniref:DUF72 domain-containing protein n=1 Tax=Rhizobacter sp. Root404 TaxID=1736528 RepID=UPI003527E92E